MIQNLLGNTSILEKKELQKKLNEYDYNTSKVDYLQQINYISKNKYNEINEENDEKEQESRGNEEETDIKNNYISKKK